MSVWAGQVFDNLIANCQRTLRPFLQENKKAGGVYRSARSRVQSVPQQSAANMIIFLWYYCKKRNTPRIDVLIMIMIIMLRLYYALYAEHVAIYTALRHYTVSASGHPVIIRLCRPRKYDLKLFLEDHATGVWQLLSSRLVKYWATSFNGRYQATAIVWKFSWNRNNVKINN